MNHQQERDELRARFTRWLEVTVYRAKLNYIEKMKHQVKTVSIEMLPEDALVEKDSETEWIRNVSEPDQFLFEEEKLTRAFGALTLMRQKILIMLFVMEKSPKEIAEQLNCSVRNVYKQRSQALEKLRTLLEEGGERQ